MDTCPLSDRLNQGCVDRTHTKKDYLGGLIKRIEVTYQAQERQHTLLMTLELPIVNDGIQYTGRGEKIREYKVVDGTDSVTLVAKKKDGRG